ncbi:MAG: cupin domain-containing protein [Deltaproteobacteria bacterium]|nr:cupin domain-containing protein [Deltaproteobacteria bacterium]
MAQDDQQAVRDRVGISTERETAFLHDVAQHAGGAREDTAPAAPLGQRISRFRQEKGLSLGDLAQRTGLTEEVLAEIEADTASPPLGTLVKLGRALDMKLGTLISSGEERAYTVVRADERQAMSRFAAQRGTKYGYTYEHLAPHKNNRAMEPFLVTLQPVHEDVPPSAHEGQEFIFVLEGEMEALVEDAREVLTPGDSIYYDSNVPHLVRPHGDQPCRIVAVIFSQDK